MTFLPHSALAGTSLTRGCHLQCSAQFGVSTLELDRFNLSTFPQCSWVHQLTTAFRACD
jgi:hypothetical protein